MLKLKAQLMSLVLAVVSSAALPAQQDHFLDLGRGGAVAKADVTATALGERNHISVIELAGDYDRSLADGSLNAAPRRAVARAFFETHPDDYDFLIVFSTFEFETGDAHAFHVGVRNDVRGIGVPLFDNSAAYGSAGRLASYVDMAAVTRHELNPLKAGFEFSLATLGHEMMHRWAARVEGDLGDLVLSSDRAHWSFWMQSGASLMYGNNWRDNGDGTFTSIADFKFYGPLDLYLAGFYAPEEVPPFFVLDGPPADRDRRFENGPTETANAIPLTIDDVIAANGPRVPPAAESQREFRAAFVLLIRPGEEVPDAVIAGLESLRREMLVRFPILTGGRALLEVFPRVIADTGTGAPAPVPGGDPRAGAVDLNDALAWLRSRQTAAGFWEDTAATRPRDTVAALEVLAAFDPAFAGAGPALAWLAGEDGRNTDFLARSAAALERFGSDAGTRRTALLAAQNPDGGWGLGRGYGSDPLDTALAVTALAGRPGVAGDAMDRARQYLLATQGADGGWGNHAAGASRAGVTARVLSALAELGAATPEVTGRAVGFLAARQNPDGGFGDSPSTAHDTARALVTLQAADALATVNAAAAVAYLENRQTEAGDWEGSVHTTALVVDALRRAAGRPNWRAVALAAEPATARDGERVRLVLEIASDGGAAAPEGLVRFYDGDPAAGGAVIDEVVVPPLAAGGLATVTSRFETFDLPGAHELFAVLDPDGAVEELKEVDNVATVAVEVVPAPDGVDLAVGAADVSVFPASPDSLPSDLAVTAVVRNLGKIDAGLVRAALWLGDPESGVRLDETEVVLPQRSSAAVSFAFTLTTPGTTALTVELDPDGAVAEDDEGNNRAAASVTTRPTTDLTVAGADLALVSPAFLGLDARFRLTVRNRGTLDTPATAVRLEVTDGTRRELVQVISVTLAAGAAKELEVPWRVSLLGDLDLEVTVDPDGFLLESDETNNFASLAFTATEIVGFNLVVGHQGITFDPDPGLQGAPAAVSAVVRNESDQPLDGVEVAFYEGDPAAGGTRLGEVQTIPTIAAAGEVTATLDLGTLIDAASRLIFVVVDPDDRIDELAEDDNRAFRVLDVLTLPDLAVSPSAITVVPASPRPGDAVSVTVAVANFGEQPARGVVVRLSDGATSQVQEQVVPLVGPASSASASFAWTFPETAGATVALRAVVDPDGAVTELTESNNAAERFVRPAGRDGELVSYRYFSPNGDGVKDTTTFFFTLAAPADVTVEVADAGGAVVRRGPRLPGVAAGDFEWDGRDAGGQLVADGDYRLRAVDDGGAVLESAVVTLDTNRSPLVDAFDTPFQVVTNITCNAYLKRRYHNFAFPFPYQEAYFTVRDDPFSNNGAFAMAPGGEPRLLVPGDRIDRLVISDDGEKFAVNGLRFGNTDGTGQGILPDFPGTKFGFRPGTHELVLGEYGFIRIVPLDGGAERTISYVESDLRDPDSRYFWDTFSPTGKAILLRGNRLDILDEIVDLENGISDRIAVNGFASWITPYPNYTWNPRGGSVAIVERPPFNIFVEVIVASFGHDISTGDFLNFPNDGMADIEALADFDVPPADNVGPIGTRPSWSPDGRELISAGYYSESSGRHSATFGRLLRFDFRSRTQQTVAFFQPVVSKFSYVVSTWDGTAWTERGRLHFGNHYDERTLELGEFLPDADGEYKVRIRQTGKDAAHVDRALLTLGRLSEARDVRPASARVLQGGVDVLELVKRHDFDVVDLHEKDMELVFTVAEEPEPEEPITLTLVAREEDFSAFETVPFRYPPQPEHAYELVVDGRGGLAVDGEQTGDDALGEPLFAEFSEPGTGHPSATVYGYATSDGENLYAALDFTIDNTLDGDRDWAALGIRTAGGWRDFRVSVTDATWGRVGFTRTGKVHHRHKYYEFRIPLAEIGAAVGDALEVRFEAYGTAAVVPDGHLFLPDRAEYPTWIPGSRKIFYAHEFAGSNWLIDVDTGDVERVLREFGNVGEPYFLDGGRKLVFRDKRDILDPQHECYNPEGEFSFFVVESAANLTARLAASPAPGGVGFKLLGTASDLHLEDWRLEYASDDVPDFWTPILPAQDHRVVDDELATWTPPRSGVFRVRLTARDRAGNAATAVRRLSFGPLGTATLTNLSATPRVISPDGDGVRDAATLRYTVLEPVHLEVAIFNARGERVRTFARDHSETGVEHTLPWDGRDQNGLPVADGDYRIEVLNFKLVVSVDTRPPQGELRLAPARAERHGSIAVAPALEWCVDEPHLAAGTIEVGIGAEPQTWSEVKSFTAALPCAGEGDPERLGLAPLDLINRRYRLRLRDSAGNEALVTAPLAAPELVLHSLAVDGGVAQEVPVSGAIDDFRISPSALRFGVTAISHVPLLQVSVQYRGSSFEPWIEVPLEVFERGAAVPRGDVPIPAFDAAWQGVALGFGGFQVRLRAVTSGQELVSNLILVGNALSLVNAGKVTAADLAGVDGADLVAAIERSGRDPDATTFLWAYNPRSESLVDVAMTIESADDPRFVGGKIFLPAAQSGRVFVFAPDELSPCRGYVTRVSGREAGSGLLVQSNAVSFSQPCLDLRVVLRRQGGAAACGEPPDGRVTVEMVPERLEGGALQALTLALDDPLDVIFNVNRPANGFAYDFEIDTGELAERYHRLFARLVNADGEELVKAVTLAVDRTSPQVILTQPASGATVCGSPVPTLTGTLTDLGALASYLVSYRTLPGAAWKVLKREELTSAALPRGGPLTETTRNGVLAELSGLAREVHGHLELRVDAVDLAGNAGCSEVAFEIDSRLDGLSALTPTVFSPDGDGSLDAARFDFVAAEPLVAGVEIFAGEVRVVDGVPRVTPVGPPLAAPVAALPVTDRAQVEWDGRDAGGNVLPDGVYVAGVRLTDGCANVGGRQFVVTLDTRPPVVDLVAPPHGAQLGGLLVALTGRVEDPGLTIWRVDVGAGENPVTFSPVASGRAPRANEPLGEWNTFGLSGVFHLRLSAEDRAGNRSEVFNRVELVGGSELINGLEAVPALISPNGDGRLDVAAVRFGVLFDAEVTVEIRRPDGALVRTLLDRAARPAGSATVVWDGRDAAGNAAADGAYRVHLRATAAGDPAVSQEETAGLEVDSTPPQLALARPREGFAAGTGPVVGSVTDPRLRSYQVALTATPQAPQWTEIGRDTAPVVGGELADLGGLAEGAYAVRLDAVDEAENRAQIVVAFSVDNTPPGVELLVPEPGAVLSAARGPFDVAGTIVEEHPKSFRLEYGAGASPAAFVELAAGEGLPAPGPLAAWDVSGLADGPYLLRLVAVDQGGLETVAAVPVEVNSSPPAVAIRQPAPGSYLTGPVEILGTAFDAAFLAYRLDVAPGPAAQAGFVELARVATPVEDGLLLDWQALPLQDGLYTLRLTAWDQAENAASTTVEVQLDRVAPAPPRGVEAAAATSGLTVRVSWQANDEADLAGYKVLRGETVVVTLSTSSTSYIDNSITTEGELAYTVVAFDHAGNESDPSATATAVIDRTPPVTLIHRPRAGKPLSGFVDVHVTAFAEKDFREYRLLADRGDGGTPQLLHRSSLPVEAQKVLEWNTLALADGVVVLRLEAEDVRDNLSTAEVAVVIDNTAPATPTGLAASAPGGDVAVSWNANAESDLLGYLLYRDGELVNARGLVDDLTVFALAATAYDDLDQPDGEHVYRVAAIDQAGNASALSEAARVTLDNRAPHAVITRPAEGGGTDGGLYVLAEVDDLDVARVEFEFRAAGEAAWTGLGSDGARPYDAFWDPVALDLPYGRYQLRAIATDEGGRTDPAPEIRTFDYKDLVPPAAVQGLAARVDGGEVTLTWQPVVEPDLAGYHVERARDDGTTLRLTVDPVATTTFVDPAAPDAELLYTVIAVDVLDNAAAPSAPAAVSVYTPQLDAPESPTPELVTGLFGIARTTAGVAVAGAEAAVTVVVAEIGTVVETTVTTDSGGAFLLNDLELARGDNEIRVTVTDANGNRSKTAVANVLSVAPPSAPTGLAGVAVYPDVELTWNRNPEPNVIGYRVLHERFPEPGRIPDGEITATASSEYSSSTRAGNPLTPFSSQYWTPLVNSTHPPAGEWWAASWALPRSLTLVQLNWTSGFFSARDFDFQIADDGGWVTVFEVRGNGSSFKSFLLPPTPPTTGLRILIHSINASPTSFQPVRLYRVQITGDPLLAEPAWTDVGAGDGTFTYSVVALDDRGFVSPPSASVTVESGDVTPPDPVTLAALAEASAVTLSWTASDAPDLAHYELYRGAKRIAVTANTTHLDAGLANGSYAYTVRAVDLLGNASAPSNTATVEVSVPVPAPPVGLTVTAPAAGRVLDLAWQPAPGSSPKRYRLRRGTVAGGPYADVVTTAATAFRNSGLTNGVTYYYVVHALDALGNLSAPSSEASGTPERVLAVPVIGYPARAGETVERRAPLLDRVAGYAEPAVAVTVYGNGAEAGRANSLSTARIDFADDLDGLGLPSPNGRWSWGNGGFFSHSLHDYETGEDRTIFDVGGDVRWMPSGDRVVYGVFDFSQNIGRIFTYRVADGVIAEIVRTPVRSFSVVQPLPDQRAFVVFGFYVDEAGSFKAGLMLIDAANGGRTVLVETPSSFTINSNTVTVSSDGRHVAYVNSSTDTVEMVAVASGARTVIADRAPSSPSLDFSPAGDAVAYERTDDFGRRQLWLYTLADGGNRQLTNGTVHHRTPRFLPDGRLLFVWSGFSVRRLDPATGEIVELQTFSSLSSHFELAKSGHLAVRIFGDNARVALPGHFEIADVPLEPGDNLLTAVAELSDGTRSAESRPVTVRLLPPDRPDLTVSGLVVSPDYPVAGGSASVQATVRNAGAANAPATDLDVIQRRPDGSTTRIGTFGVAPLAAGAERTVSGLVTFTGAGGLHTAVAIVDPRNRVAESAEENNRAEAAVRLLGSASPAVFVTTDAAGYSADAPVAIAVDAVNGGAESFSGRVEVTVEDATGFLVAELAGQPVSLAGGLGVQFNRLWSTGSTFAGSYRVRAVLRADGGAAVAEATAPFSIIATPRVTASVVTDRELYDPGAVVRVTSTVRLAGNAVVPAAEARLTVRGAGGVQLERQRPLGDLLPGSESSFSVDWRSAGAPEGLYRAELEVVSGGEILRAEVAVFTLGDVGPPRLVATKTDVLAADVDGDGAPGAGDVVRYEITVTNAGGLPATGVTFHDLLPEHTTLVPGSLAASRGTVVSEAPVEVDLGTFEPGEAATLSFEVTVADPLPDGVFEIANQGSLTSAELPVVLTDDPDRGGDADPTVTPVAGVPELVAEKTAVLAVDADGGGAPSPGDTLAYEITLTNSGAVAATGVTVIDPVPAHTAVVAGSVAASRGAVESEDPPQVFVGELLAGESVTVAFEVTVDLPIAAGVTEIVNQGLVVSDQLDDVATDDPAAGGPADPTVTPISAAPALVVEKTASLFADAAGDGLASPGDELLYRVEIRNTGNVAATGVAFADAVPEHAALIAGSLQASRGAVTGEDPPAVDLGAVAAGGEPVVVTFRVAIADPFPIDVLALANQATVASAELAPVVSDDPATAPAGDATVTPVYVTPEVSVADVSLAESAGSAVFTVTLSEPSNRTVRITAATSAGTAGAGLDYLDAASSLELAPGETTAEVVVEVLDDALDEDDETFVLGLTVVEGAVAADAEAVATIVDDDPPPVLTVAAVTVVEGDPPALAEAVFVLELSTPSGRAVAVTAATGDGTAVAGPLPVGGNDYQATSATVLIAPGELTAEVRVPVLADLVDERDETFVLHLGDPVNVTLASAAVTATIADDDVAAIAIDDVAVDEGPDGPGQALFTVSLATLADREIRVDYATAAATATAGEDFAPAAGTLVFAPGVTAAGVAVAVLDDGLLEDDEETFRVELANAVETTIADAEGLGTIRDDELCPGPELLDNPGAEGRVKAGVIPGWTATDGGDWQVAGEDPEPFEGAAYFFAGAADAGELYQDVDAGAYAERIATGSQLFAFSARVRTRDEAPPDVARIFVEYRDAANAVVLDAFDSGDLTNPFEWLEVTDARPAPPGTRWIRVRLLATRFADAFNDGYFDALSLRSRRAATVTIGDVAVYEGHAGTAEASFQVELACPYAYEVGGSFTTADGTAVAGEDYVAAAGAFSFPVGETRFTLPVTILADDVDELPVESFTVELGELASAGMPVLLDGSARGDVLNDDFCPRSPGYWKNHRDAWVIDEVRLGGVWYDDLEMLGFLSAGGPDAAIVLAHHLVATRLNLARGSDPRILPTVAEADAFLAAHPPGPDPRGPEREAALRLKDALDAYNNSGSCDGGGGGGGGGGGNGNGNGNGNSGGGP